MSIFSNFFKKEAPLLGLQGSGGGLGFLAGSGGGEPTFTIYMMGGGARTRADAIRAGYSEATITIPYICNGKLYKVRSCCWCWWS